MQIRRLFETNAAEQSKTFHIYDDETGLTSFETVQDVTDLMTVNAENFKTGPVTGRGKADGMRRVASIPLVIYYQLKKAGILNDPKRMAKWLDERDNQAFRTSPERVSFAR